MVSTIAGRELVDYGSNTANRESVEEPAQLAENGAVLITAVTPTLGPMNRLDSLSSAEMLPNQQSARVLNAAEGQKNKATHIL
jgi:hypothetical protein